jgi:hypothetical protein
VLGKKGEHIATAGKGKGARTSVSEDNGLPLAFLVTAANVAEVTVGLKVVDQVKVPRPQGQPRQRPASLAADKSYDSATSGGSFAGEGFSRLCQGRSRPPLVHQVSQSSWRVERSHEWLDNWRRLVTRYNWYTESYIAFLTIVCLMVTRQGFSGREFWDYFL